MNGTAMKPWARGRNGVLALVVVGMVLAAASSAVYAAPSPATGQGSLRPVTIVDPFALRTVTVSTAPPTTTPTAQVASAASSLSSRRPTVRIPARVPYRTAFHPVQ